MTGTPTRSIAIFDYRIVPTNPVGGCHRRLLERLAADHDFTVFAVDFDAPCSGRVTFRRVPALRRPLALLFVSYHLMAPVCYWIHRLRRGKRFDLVQMVESNLSFGDVAYSHFCHRAYLRLQAASHSGTGPRQWLRWLDHRLHQALEPWIYRRAKHIVVPSRGVAAELEREYPQARGKVRVIHNPVDTERMRRPADFDPSALRSHLGVGPDDLLLAFAALGHFERKGLPILLEALRRIEAPRLKLVVVGGEKSLVRVYEARARSLGLAGRVAFVGHRQDVRPYLWAADAFAFPSHYETFSLVTFEAAAAGLPLIVPLLHGVEELVRNGENGFVIRQTVESTTEALRRFLDLTGAERREMGRRAARDVERYSLALFAPRWREFYDSIGLGTG